MGGDFVSHAAHVPGHFTGAVRAHGDEVVAVGLGEGDNLLRRHPILAEPVNVQALILEILAGLSQKGITEFVFVGFCGFDRGRGTLPAKAPMPL